MQIEQSDDEDVSIFTGLRKLNSSNNPDESLSKDDSKLLKGNDDVTKLNLTGLGESPIVTPRSENASG